MLDTGSYSSRLSRVLRAGGLPLLAAALLALAVLLPPMVAPVTAQESGVEFLIVEGRRSDGSGGSFVSANSQTISEGLDVNYYIRLRTQPSANVTVAPANSSSAVEVNTGSDQPLTFTPQNWSQAQNVQVFTSPGAADDDNAGSITHTVSSDDSGYDGLTPSFTLNIVGTGSGCTASAAPALTVGTWVDRRTMEEQPLIEVVTSAASCGSTPIVGYDTAFKENDGQWSYSSSTRAAYPSAWTYSVQPATHSLYDVSSGSTYKVKTRGITYQQGTTPWSPEAEVTVTPATVENAGGL